MSKALVILQRAGRGFVVSLDPLSKLAQIVAVVIAGVWTYHLRTITGTGEQNPEVWVSAQALTYGKDTRLLSVHSAFAVGPVPATAPLSPVLEPHDAHPPTTCPDCHGLSRERCAGTRLPSGVTPSRNLKRSLRVERTRVVFVPMMDL
jgi:hypothetical protein